MTIHEFVRLASLQASTRENVSHQQTAQTHVFDKYHVFKGPPVRWPDTIRTGTVHVRQVWDLVFYADTKLSICRVVLII